VKTKVSPAVVGAFVIGAFALGTLALLAFGGFSFWEKPQRFVVYFNESIHGLDQGSAVKLRGVRVGRVVNLKVRYDATQNRSFVAVVCELNRDVVTDPNGALLDVGTRAALEQLVQRGLRAQLGVAGLATGLLFVELDFKNPNEFPADAPRDASESHVVVPQVPSLISEYQKSLGEILANVKDLDLAGLAKDISTLAQTAKKQVEGVDIKGLTEQWKRTGAQFEALATNPDFKKTFDNLNAAVTDLRSTIAKLDAQIDPAGKELTATLADARKTVQAFNETATAAKSFITSHAGLGSELGETLSQLNEAADAVKRLADFLERNPNALITGRKRP